jgi:hypothetical protein
VLLPTPRGLLSAELIEYLRGAGAAPLRLDTLPQQPLADEDLQLALYIAYELHYRGFDDVDPDSEWDPRVIEFRRALEAVFLDALRDAVPRRERVAPGDVGALLFELAAADDGPGLSERLGRTGTLEEFREFAIHRSAYQLKEADPHSWAIPRLDGAAKAALLEVQFDEYGSGKAERIHARLFGDAMEAMGLDGTYGAYLDAIPGYTLATVNLMTMFGLQRRWRGAIVGHLAMFEITSAAPNRSCANGLRRLGLEEATDFFDEHVEADSVHENIAAHDLAGGLAREEPELTGDIVWGADCLLELDRRSAESIIGAWDRGESSLLAPLPSPA